MKIEFVRIDLNNKPTSTAETEQHKDIIKEYSIKGFKYVGFFPVKFGPSGKMLSIDLIFEKYDN